MVKFALVMALTALLPLAVVAQDAPSAEAPISASNAHVLSANPMTAAAAMTLTNTGSDDCTLTAVGGDVAERIELHTNVETDGIMRMVQLEDGVVVPAGGSAELGPGGHHVMLMGLTAPLKPGDTVDLVLDFGTCGTLPITASVVEMRGHDSTGHAMHDTMEHGMDHGADSSAAH